uniref:Histidine kinase n=1 Tax=Caenorhabditis tropicalis TaxID=1561998 RepID=A0A1I7UDP0_9PELO
MSDIHQKAQELFLESQIVNGKKSSIELAEELLGTTINVTLFKEYAEINTEKLKELKKPEKMSFEDKIKVIKAFHKLNDQVSMEQISDLVKGVIDRITLNLNQKKTAYKRFKELFEYIATRLDDFESVSQGGWRSEKALKTALQEAKDMILELDEVIEKPGKTRNLDTNVQIIQDFLLGELIKKLDELITIGINPLETVPLAEMESFLRYMEEFRDNLGFEFLEKVRETIDQIKEFEFPKEFILKYRNIDSVREFLLKVLRFAENVETKRIQLKTNGGQFHLET